MIKNYAAIMKQLADLCQPPAPTPAASVRVKKDDLESFVEDR